MRRADACWLIATAMIGIAGCGATTDGPIPIARGTECSICRMGIQNLRYACERQAADGMHMYDSIECLIRDSEADGNAWLADYDTQALHAIDSMWVVKGDIPSPMGGGLAAFLDRRAAEDVAAETAGVVTRFSELVQETTGAPS